MPIIFPKLLFTTLPLLSGFLFFAKLGLCRPNKLAENCYVAVPVMIQIHKCGFRFQLVFSFVGLVTGTVLGANGY